MANPKNAAWYGGDVCGFLVPGAGSIYYVDGLNGLNTNDGLGADTPFLDITYALTQCTSGRNDYIFVIQYPPDGSEPGTETYPIAVNKHRVHIIGGAFAHAEADKYAFLGATGDTQIFDIQAQWVEIAYMKLAGGTNHAAIEFTGDGPTNKGFAIHHNIFNQKNGTVGFPAYGIWMELENTQTANWGYIAYNYFGPSNTNYAINIHANPVMLRIHNNMFLKPAAISIYMDGPMAYCEVTDNRFSLLTDTTGMAITFTARCWDPLVAYVDGNRAHVGATQMGQNPFRDLSPVVGKQNWGLNHAGPASTLPVTA